MLWVHKKTQKQLSAACFKMFPEPRKFHAKVVRMTSDVADLYK